MKPIQLRKAALTIPFVDEKGETKLTLKFDRSDQNIKRLYDSFDKLAKQAEEFETNAEENDFEAATVFIKETVDSIFDVGTFDKLYEISPSIHIVTVYFYQMAIGIKEELEAEDIKAVEAKYLK